MMTQPQTRTGWQCLEVGVWVSYSDNGRPRAIVTENWRRGFEARLANGIEVGLFPTLEAAKQEAERAAASQPAGAR
jgi:hypothetical protein